MNYHAPKGYGLIHEVSETLADPTNGRDAFLLRLRSVPYPYDQMFLCYISVFVIHVQIQGIGFIPRLKQPEFP